MNDPKWHLIDRVLSFRRERRFFRQAHTAKQPCFDDAMKKGTAFEQFVVRKFNPEHFTLIEWRSDKHIDGIFPLMSKFPDLEFFFESQTQSMTIAVECKWRESFYHDQIFLEPFQLENYNHYEYVTGHCTFIVIGVGNTPSSPNEVYILPLREITSPHLHAFNMHIYKRQKPDDKFFLNCNAGLLS